MNQRNILIDLLRAIALIGMILINFKVVMFHQPGSSGIVDWQLSFLEGKFAALFVILSGFVFYSKNLKFNNIKVLILFIIGMLNQIIFPADIIHYYSLFFFFGFFLLNKSLNTQLIALVFVAIISTYLTNNINHLENWNKVTLEYPHFWSIKGFLSNTFLDGWHPFFPWFIFFQWGMILKKFKDYKRLVLGSLVVIISYGLLQSNLSLSPIPINMNYIVFSCALWTLLISCTHLMRAQVQKMNSLKLISKTGQMTLTHYFFHIYIGLGIFDELGTLEVQNINTVFLRVAIYTLVTLIFSIIWLRFYKRGPLELCLKRLTKVF